MPKYRVTLKDSRTVDVFAPDEKGAKAQAIHWERDRFVMAVKRGENPGANPSEPKSVKFLKP